MKQTFLILLLLPAFFLSAQEDHNGAMQRLPEGVELSEYRVRYPTGLEEVKTRIEPQNWWTGMQDPKLELMIYDRNIAQGSKVSIDYPGVSVQYVEREENPNYLFVGLFIGPGTKAGEFTIFVRDAEGQSLANYTYVLEEHPSVSRRNMKSPGLNAKDLIYLIMPDRFANGDRKNDIVEGMRQTGIDRDKFLFRHGGDLLGIMERLDYLQDLGVTALWLNPVLENDQPYESYHGYAITDHTKVDPRFGTNEQYQQLVKLAHERGMKVIMDVVFNQVGDYHWQILDLPSADWIHQFEEYTKTTYRATTHLDPHASETDKKLMTDGWFDDHMPDLNQKNPHLARYLIQNSLWWAAYSGQDGYRIDTYSYSDAAFMAEWNRRMLEEFPYLGIFGETWVHGSAVQAWFTGSETLHSFNSNLPGVTDFQLYYALGEALTQDPGWTSGVNRLYYTLAKDYLYDDPTRNVLFLDNHDLARVFTALGEDTNKMKSALSMLFTLRGIPMLYYGTEMGLTGAGGTFGEGGRVDFPGGWRKDETNLFDPAARNDTQRDIFNFVRKMANFRKNSPALTEGKLTQFVPRDGVYAFFRHTTDQRIMVIFNGNSDPKTVDPSTYVEMIAGYQTATELSNDQRVSLKEMMKLKGKETKVLLLNK